MRSIWLGIGAFVLALPASGSAPVGYPPNTVLLFVASWCAPCHAELARLAAIDRGAKPFRVLVVPYDQSPATLAMLEPVPAAQRWQVDRVTRRQVARDMAQEAAGLPFSMAIGREGRPCASKAGGIDAVSAARLVEQCLR